MAKKVGYLSPSQIFTTQPVQFFAFTKRIFKKFYWSRREDLTWPQISDFLSFFGQNLASFGYFEQKVRLSDLGQINLTTLSTLR